MTRRATSTTIPLDPETARMVVDAAIAWFAEHGRDLPWRHTRDPWAVLVSEVMLQQLRVARTQPFYERFIERFPTPASLAGASLGEALRVWGDLGRYRAAAALHRSAGIIVEEHGGEVPASIDALLALPGVGPYTAGAVCCFAFEQDTAFLDTNARRVLHRVFVGSDVPAATVGVAALRDLSRRLVPPGRGWAWNQALIEVGALRCKARSVDCGGCPLSPWCLARTDIGERLKELPRRAPVAPPYLGTSRQHRGQVLRALREAEDIVVSVGEIGRRVRPGFGEADRPWLDALVADLERDGLIRRGPAPTRGLAEEQAVYWPDGVPPAEAEEGISLP